jgi:putative aminophosphonate oxidoreductase
VASAEVDALSGWDGRSERSWWLATVDGDGADAPRLEGPTSADVCIVGGGFTGLWTALNLKQRDPGLDVAIVEAETCGSGASGRNGGCALTYWHHFTNLQAICGTAEALRLARASADAVAEIGPFCEEHGIDAGYRADGWLWTATNAAQVGRWRTTLDAISSAGEGPFVEAGAEELAARTGSRSHLAGVYEASAASVQPAALARGLRRVALDHGVRIFEWSPMVKLDRSSPLVVECPLGSVRAGRVILAMNAWAAQVRELRNSFVIVSSDLAITAPVEPRLTSLGWTDGVCVSDSRLMVHYYRTTPEGRIAFGRGGARLAHGRRVGSSLQGPSPARDADWLEDSFHTLYPDLEDVPFAAAWAGPIDRPVDGLPFFTTLGRPDLICGVGFAGNGVAPCLLAGRTLASMAIGADDEWSSSGLVRPIPKRLPPEPLRSIGGLLVKRAVRRQETAEDAGRKPAWVDARLAALAPSGLVPLN